jgi:hypothetical protein
LAERVDVVDTENPLLLCELDLSTKVVNMSDQGAENLSLSGICFGAHKVNDMLCEVWIEFAAVVFGSVSAVGATVRSHDDVLRVCMRAVVSGVSGSQAQLRFCSGDVWYNPRWEEGTSSLYTVDTGIGKTG